MGIITATIREVQGQQSDGEFAEFLGVDRSLLSKVRRGKEEPGKKLLMALARNFPETQWAIWLYLSGQDIRWKPEKPGLFRWLRRKG